MRVECLYKSGRAGRPGGGDRPPCAPVGGAPPVARGGVAVAPPARDLFVNWKKKITNRSCRLLGGRPGYIFEIFRDEHIFF